MKPWKKNLILALVVIFAVVSSFFIGSWKGFYAGLNWNREEDAALNGSIQATLLKKIRQQKIDDAIKMLESSLDSNIVTYWAYSLKINKSIFDHYAPVARNQYGPNFMKNIAKYRKEYPSRADPYGKALIDKTLAEFDQK